jgi:hypothetical protein
MEKEKQFVDTFLKLKQPKYVFDTNAKITENENEFLINNFNLNKIFTNYKVDSDYVEKCIQKRDHREKILREYHEQ